MKSVHGWPRCTSSRRLIFQKKLLEFVHHRVTSTQPITCNTKIQEIGKQAYKQGTMKMVHCWGRCTSLSRPILNENLLQSVHPRVTLTHPIACNNNIQEIGKQAYRQGTMKMVHGWPRCTSSSTPISNKNLLKLVHSRVTSAHPIACISNIQEIGKQAYKKGTMNIVHGWPAWTSSRTTI